MRSPVTTAEVLARAQALVTDADDPARAACALISTGIRSLVRLGGVEATSAWLARAVRELDPQGGDR